MEESTQVLEAPVPAPKPASKPKPKVVKKVAKPAAKPAKAKAKPSANGKPQARDKRLPKPGSVIKRTYLGKEYAVKVKTDTFEFKGKEYTSLSAVAKALRKSDQEVNGFSFFGLTK